MVESIIKANKKTRMLRASGLTPRYGEIPTSPPSYAGKNVKPKPEILSDWYQAGSWYSTQHTNSMA
ncbi:MAG: hypothetical protein ACP5VQ_09375 [Phycisphaerae bacterium]